MRKVIAQSLLITSCFAALAWHSTAFSDVCSTQSRGIYFVSSPGEVDAATNQALNMCTANQLTNNNECSQNIACGYYAQNPYTSGTAACFTSSNNVAFQITGSPSDINNLVNSALAQCTGASMTNNQDCNSRLQCGDLAQTGLPYPSNRVVCVTNSHNISFPVQGDASQVQAVANSAVQQCTANSVTNNTECSQNLSCQDSSAYSSGGGGDHDGGDHHDGDGGGYHGGDGHHDGDRVVCFTSSHNIDFRQAGPRSTVDQVTQAVLSQCTANPVTNNNECAQNLRCN